MTPAGPISPSSALDRPTFPRVLGNLDIWEEILQYFEVWADEGPADVKHKRLGALGIALLSPFLSGVALKILWKNMSSLEPLVYVINAFSPQPCLYFDSPSLGMY